MKEKKTLPGQKPSAGVDWTAVRERIGAAMANLERASTDSPEEQRNALRTRAKTLAQPLEEKQWREEGVEVVEFLLAYERYGIETSYVREVYPLKELTALPGLPPFVLGIINLRGQILSVLDIKKFFDLPEKGLTDLNKVLVVRTGQMELGILADAILGVRVISPQDLQPSLPTLTGIRADYLKGVTKERLTVLDALKILTDKKIVVQEQTES
ncbi:MAG: chemotaxis protein CheW [Acidobacteria bacterium]|nr:chemotaxis protein CheW [Acidobacteriota bacterium]